MQLQRANIARNVVLFRTGHCTFDFTKLTQRHLTGLLDLQSHHDVTILRSSPNFLRLQCSTSDVKRHILNPKTKTSAADLFSIRIKDDLFKHERQQKAEMWSVMQALFGAGFRPTWSRSSIMWEHSNSQYFIHYGEIPTNATAEEILQIARQKCMSQAAPGTIPSQPVSATVPFAVSIGSQTEGSPQPSYNRTVQNLIIALQQDVAAAKQRVTAKTVECCMLRMKLAVRSRVTTRCCSKAVQAEPDTSSNSSQTEDTTPSTAVHEIADTFVRTSASVQTDPSSSVCTQVPSSRSPISLSAEASVQTDEEDLNHNLSESLLKAEIVRRVASIEQELTQQMKAEVGRLQQMALTTQEELTIAKGHISTLLQVNETLKQKCDELVAQMARSKQKKCH
jgi:hypothetical protein